MSDVEPVDTKPAHEEACKPQCQKYWAAYEACVERVRARTDGEGNCQGQYFDFWHCVDACAAPKIFKDIK